jgi:hypothetical protein
MRIQIVRHNSIRGRLRGQYAFYDDCEDERGVKEICTVIAKKEGKEEEYAILINEGSLRFFSYEELMDALKAFKRYIAVKKNMRLTNQAIIEDWKKARTKVRTILSEFEVDWLLPRIERHLDTIMDGCEMFHDWNRDR